MSIINWIKTIRETQGTNAKLDLLKGYIKNETFKKVLYYAYNPFYNYYIRKIPKVTPSGTSMVNGYGFEEMFNLLDELRNRVFTGNFAIERVTNFLRHATAPVAEVLVLIFGRDLKMGVNTTSINKVCPNLIPTFDVMLADAGIPLDKVFKDNEWVYVQKKSDGKRCIAICKANGVEFFARSGKEIENLTRHEELKNSIQTLRNCYIKYDFVLDGELIIENEDGTDEDRQISNGLIMKKNLPKEEVERFSFVVWDILSLDDFQNDSNSTPYEERYCTLINNIKWFSKLKVIETFVATTVEEAMEITNDFMAKGFEGSIIKTPYHFYRRKRSKDWIKIKSWNEIDLKIIGYENGAIGTKYENCLGSLICSNGTINCKVGSGFSDQQRNSIKEDVIGKVLTIKYNQLIKDANGNYSLFLPVFSEIRDDKFEADSMEKILKETIKK